MAKTGDTFNIVEEQLKRARQKRDTSTVAERETARAMRSFEDPDPGMARLTTSLGKLQKSLARQSKGATPSKGRQVRMGMSASDIGALKREKMRVPKERNIKGARAGGLVGKKKVGRHRGDGIARQGLTKGRMA